MLVSLDSNGEWIKGCPDTKEPFWAFHDQSDPDVLSCGLLLALSAAGHYVLETGYFNNTPTYAVGDPVIVDGTTGNITKGGALGAETADVLGIVQELRQNTTSTNSEGGTIAGPNYTLIIATEWKPSRA